MPKIKRSYEPPEKEDGFRVLVDRLWPRGIKKSKFIFNDWAQELAPSTELRKRFNHDPKKWREFRSKYRKELRKPNARRKLEALAKLTRRRTVTLLYSARDEAQNDAVVLKDVIRRIARKLKHP